MLSRFAWEFQLFLITVIVFLFWSSFFSQAERDVHMWFLALFAVNNAIAFLVYKADKERSINDEWRIPEFKLHLFCAFYGFGGSLLAMHCFCHKTSKQSFRNWTLICACVNCAIYYLIWSVMLRWFAAISSFKDVFALFN